MEIYNDILNAVVNELLEGQAKPIRLQLIVIVPMTKLLTYPTELKNKNFLIKNPPTIPEKGWDFLRDYDRIANFVLEMGIKCFDQKMVIRGRRKIMNTENVDYHPIKFIDHLDRNKHIVLLFDNEKYAYWIISHIF